MSRQFKSIDWDDAALSLRNAAPIFLGGHVASRIRKVLSISVEKRLSEGHHCVVTIRHPEIDAHEPVSVVVVEAPNLDRICAIRGDNDFCHLASFRGDSAPATIAEGGAATSPVLNSRDRTAGGPH